MFMGITSHRNALSVRSYADAERCLDRCSRTPTGKARKSIELRSSDVDRAFPLGLTKRGQTMVIRYNDSTIAFRLYDTDVVTWHPDNSVAIDNFGTVTTSGFASQFLPAGFHLRYPVERRGSCGGDKGIVYRPGGADDWRNARICFGGIVRFMQDGDGWTPDESTLDKLVFPVLNHGEARKLARDLQLSTFETWLAVAPFHLELEHRKVDVGMCESALRRGDWATAAMHLPLIKETHSWGGHNLRPLPIRSGYQEHVTMGSIGKLKLALWEEHGMLEDEVFTTVSRGEFDRRMARVRELDALGYGGYGPRTY